MRNSIKKQLTLVSSYMQLKNISFFSFVFLFFFFLGGGGGGGVFKICLLAGLFWKTVAGGSFRALIIDRGGSGKLVTLWFNCGIYLYNFLDGFLFLTFMGFCYKLFMKSGMMSYK
jgi:hypothetical protein